MIKIYTIDVTFFYYIFRSLGNLFDIHGIPYQMVNRNIEELSPEKRNDNDLWIIGFDCLWDIAVTFKKNIVDYLPQKFIYYHSEAIDEKMRDVRYFEFDYIKEYLPKAQQVWNYSQLYNQWFLNKNINSVFVPLSYTPFLDLPEKYHNKEKTIDVLFYGLINERRKKCITELKNSGLNVSVFEGQAFGDYLDELISKSKIVLSIHYSDQKEMQQFDFSRLSVVICKKAVIVAEKSNNEETDKIFGNKINITTFDNIVQMCQNIISNYEHYQSIAENTYEWYKKEYNLKKFIDLDLIRNLICPIPSIPSPPSLPSEPSPPSLTSEPSELSELSLPSEPSELSEPSEPSLPSEPSEPSLPSEPSEPSLPSEPSELSELSEPSEPLEKFIPKIFHTYWHKSQMPYLNYLTIMTFMHYHPIWEIRIYIPTKIENSLTQLFKDKNYWPQLIKNDNVKIIPIDFDQIGFYNDAPEIIKSNYIRYYALSQDGGLWSDPDIFYINSVEKTILSKNYQIDNVLFYWNEIYLIGFLIAGKKNEFFCQLCQYSKKYYNSNDLYCIGYNMIKQIWNHPDQLKDKFKNLNIMMSTEMLYLPFKSHELNEIFMIDSMDRITPETMGIYWHQDSDLAKNYSQAFIDNGSTMSSLIKDFINSNDYDNKWLYKEIPKIMFTYWYGPMSYLHYLSVKSFLDLNPDWKIQLYYPKYSSTLQPTWKSPQNAIQYTGKNWYDELKKLNIEFIAIDFDEIGFSNAHNEIIKSDYLRLYILSTQGGLWSDADILYIKPMNSLMLNEHIISGKPSEIDTIISCHHVRKYYSIGFLLSSPNNVFFKYLLEQSRIHIDNQRYESIGSSLYKKLFDDPYQILKMFPNLNLVNLGLDFVYPYPDWEVDKIFNHNDKVDFESDDVMSFEKNGKMPRYPIDSKIRSRMDRTIGIHWFNGHPAAKEFINNENYESNVTINNTIKKYHTQKQKLVFMVPVYENNPLQIQSTCVRCIQSIRRFYPQTFIMIINDSPQSILSDNDLKRFFNDPNLDVIHPETQGSACSYALNYLNTCNQFDYGIILQDSTILINKFDEINYDMKFLWYFSLHHKWDVIKVPFKHPTIKTHTDEIMNFYQNINDSQFKKNFVKFYANRDLWRGCMGTMLVISKKFLQQVENKTQILSLTPFVKTRRDRMCMESILAIAIFYTKHFDMEDEDSYSLQGDWCKEKVPLNFDNHNGVIGKYLQKYGYGR